MKDKRAFWDSSAIIPVITRQDASQRARQLLKRHSRPVVSWTTLIEIHSALSRLLRKGEIDESGRQNALVRLTYLEQAWDEVLPTSKLRILAIEMLKGYDLRAADAIQLASAMIWCLERPRKRPFITFDERLATAAFQAGFDSSARR